MTCWLFCLTLPSIKATVDSAKAMSCNPVERSSPMATGHKECQPILDVVSGNLYCIQCFAGRNPLSILPVYLPLSTQGPLCKKSEWSTALRKNDSQSVFLSIWKLAKKQMCLVCGLQWPERALAMSQSEFHLRITFSSSSLWLFP